MKSDIACGNLGAAKRRNSVATMVEWRILSFPLLSEEGRLRDQEKAEEHP
jgi:hypothetical protein